jgi:hypothetical protein
MCAVNVVLSYYGLAVKCNLVHGLWRIPLTVMNIQKVQLGPVEGKQLTTGWTVRASNSGEGDMLCTRPDQPWNPPRLLSMGPSHSLWQSGRGVASTTYSHYRRG